MAFEIIKGIKAVDLALYFDKTLVISDVHMGYEEAMNKAGVLIPRRQYADTINLLEQTFAELKIYRMPVEKVVINGDLKHEFGTISETEWRNTLGVLDFLLKKCKNVILIKGNHDNILGPIAGKRGIVVKDYEIVKDVLLCHGDKIPRKDILEKVKTIIIGHEHAAVSLKEGSRVEKFKCFLRGKWKGKSLIAMPSFNTAVEGSDILKEELLSPFLKDIADFEVLVVGDGKILDFGAVSNLRAL